MNGTPAAPSAPAPATPPQSPKPSLVRRSLRGLYRALLLGGVGVAVLLGLWLLAASSYSYSKGDRAGLLQKFSAKGWVCKTWEGELQLASPPGVPPERFQFSVRDEAVAAQVQAQVGQQVTLAYEQHKGLPSCLGETEYFVTGVRKLAP
jgi:hypothetical protein